MALWDHDDSVIGARRLCEQDARPASRNPPLRRATPLAVESNPQCHTRVVGRMLRNDGDRAHAESGVREPDLDRFVVSGGHGRAPEAIWKRRQAQACFSLPTAEWREHWAKRFVQAAGADSLGPRVEDRPGSLERRDSVLDACRMGQEDRAPVRCW